MEVQELANRMLYAMDKCDKIQGYENNEHLL